MPRLLLLAIPLALLVAGCAAPRESQADNEGPDATRTDAQSASSALVIVEGKTYRCADESASDGVCARYVLDEGAVGASGAASGTARKVGDNTIVVGTSFFRCADTADPCQAYEIQEEDTQ